MDGLKRHVPRTWNAKLSTYHGSILPLCLTVGAKLFATTDEDNITCLKCLKLHSLLPQHKQKQRLLVK